MRVRMLRTVPGSPNGVKVNLYKEGREYDLTERLGHVFVLQLGAAKEVNPPENKEVISAPERKKMRRKHNC